MANWFFEEGNYLYFGSGKPMKGIMIDVGCPPPGTMLFHLDYEEEEEVEPLMIEFSL